VSKAILSEFDPQLSLLVDHLSGCGKYHTSPVLVSVDELNFAGTYVTFWDWLSTSFSNPI
jgi:hypothetical protein